jgi:Zn-dependent M28 family amino/carboxypeptidase
MAIPPWRSQLFAALAVGMFSCLAVSETAGPTLFDGERALADVEKLVGFGPRPSGSDAHRQTQEYLLHELRATGLKIVRDDFTAQTPVGPIPMSNLIAVHRGRAEKFLVFAGHYDTKRFDEVPFLGANDGGSSAALILELARAVARIEPSPSTAVWFVLLDGEEAVVNWTDTDSLYGSRHLASRMEKNQELSRIAAFILVDMVGDRDLGIHRDRYSTRWLQDLVWAEAERLGHGEHFLDVGLYIDDDHIPFARKGVPVLDVIDFEYGPENRFWHSPADTMDKVSAESLQVVGETLLGVLTRLDRHLAE